MIAEIDRRLENLFRICDEVSDAERLEDTEKLRAKLFEGLQESCLLLQDLLRLCATATKRGPSDTQMLRSLQRLQNEDELQRFLSVERKALNSTRLSSRTKDNMISMLSEIVPRMMHERVLSKHAIGSLREFAGNVCRESSGKISFNRHRRLLRRAVIVATGGLVVVVNSTVTLAAPIAAYSVPAGWFVAGAGATGVLDDWANRR